MSKRMLFDGAHPEEIRIAVTSGNQLEEYDIETSFKKQVKGNIYLAKVMRVEPSLQAAFVEFGGDRHGFLAFGEIHPDYYQIPIEDRQKLLEQQEALERDARAAQELLEDIDGGIDGSDPDAPLADAGDGMDAAGESGDEQPPPPSEPGRRRYKIQDVIRRRQVILVQVVKEERGSKGAALTTYISLAGRYCVLMPNSSRGGGISRKITAAKERRKLRDTLDALDIPEGMGVIIRTAGMERNKGEIKRDFEYLLRTWDEIRGRTLESTAPCLVYEEGDIVKRAIRDVYSRDIEEILVEGQKTYQSAKQLMKLMIPSHARRVQHYRDDPLPLFQRYKIEQQLEAMHGPEAQLKSGGYLVINPTEALVAIDVNSGRATRERTVEGTAVRTNLEAADEVARQLRLRDLAGLIVIDFIDMEDSRNVRKVEKRLRDAMKNDRARLQIGRISEFGLLELSRQRLRPSLIETSSRTCPSCRGTGTVLSTESMALRVLRAIEEEGARATGCELTVRVPTEVALYVLNHKRPTLLEMESRHKFTATFLGDDTIVPPDVGIERNHPEPTRKAAEENADGGGKDEQKRNRRRRGRRQEEEPESSEAVQDDEPVETGGAESAEKDSPHVVEPREIRETGGAESAEKDSGQRRRRRGRRGGVRRRDAKNGEASAKTASESDAPDEQRPDAGPAPETSADEPSAELPAETAGEPADDMPGDVAQPPTDVLVETADAARNAPAADDAPTDDDAEPLPVDDAASPRPAERPETPSRRRGWWQRISG